MTVLVVCATVAGCATSRSEITLGGPAAIATARASVPTDRTIVIRSVIDERVFEQAPDDPSTPSLGFGGANQASADIKSRAIGRKRNGFGKALGDILLDSGQTVEGVIRDNLAAALGEAGYRVVGDSEAGPTTRLMDVRIKQFWTWFKPGFWAITLNANIATDLHLSGAAEPIRVVAHSTEQRQMATDGAWMQIAGKALAEYRAQAKTQAATLP